MARIAARMTATRLSNPQGTVRQGLGATSRRDPWWLVPGIIAGGFGTFIAYSLFSALIWEGMLAVAKYFQIASSSGPGNSSTSALSVALPARPTCW